MNCGCTKKLPVDASLCTLIRIPGDSLELIFIDSYYRIKDYETHTKNDTLYINIKYVEHFYSTKEITINFDKKIHIVSINNEYVFEMDSIPFRSVNTAHPYKSSLH